MTALRDLSSQLLIVAVAIDRAIGAIRSAIYAKRAGSERSLMARGVFNAAAAEPHE